MSKLSESNELSWVAWLLAEHVSEWVRSKGRNTAP